MGRYVTAGERFESFRPGYQVVKVQRTMPRFESGVTSAHMGQDARTLVVETSPRFEAVNYALMFPELKAAARRSDSSRGEIDLLSDLTGVGATWRDARGHTNWNGWLPHLDLAAARGFTAASLDHQRLFKMLRKPGTLTVRCQLELWQMLHPAVQPAATLDYEYPPETVTVVLKASSKLDVQSSAKIERPSDHEVHLKVSPSENAWVPLELALATGVKDEPVIEVSWFTAEDPRARALPLRRILLPWARPNIAPAIVTRIPEIEGGDWERGKKVFFGEQATCSKCHQVGGEGGTIGADLSNLIYRDYASVLKDINEPSAAINPEHLSYNVELKDGSVETGVLLHNNQDKVVLGPVTGKDLTIAKTNVVSMKASSISLMPEGLLKLLDPRQQKDLFTFLLLPAPKTNGKSVSAR
jgi:putative heme-binding domain-containing protein